MNLPLPRQKQHCITETYWSVDMSNRWQLYKIFCWQQLILQVWKWGWTPLMIQVVHKYDYGGYNNTDFFHAKDDLGNAIHRTFLMTESYCTPSDCYLSIRHVFQGSSWLIQATYYQPALIRLFLGLLFFLFHFKFLVLLFNLDSYERKSRYRSFQKAFHGRSDRAGAFHILVTSMSKLCSVTIRMFTDFCTASSVSEFCRDLTAALSTAGSITDNTTVIGSDFVDQPVSPRRRRSVSFARLWSSRPVCREYLPSFLITWIVLTNPESCAFLRHEIIGKTILCITIQHD